VDVKFTPGPWIVNGNEIAAPEFDNGIATWYVRVASVDGTRETGWNAPTIKANARLIAAAPDMLAMLHEVLALLNNPDADGTDANRVEREILAVIAKATGGAR
jgi:hypothetical protein